MRHRRHRPDYAEIAKLETSIYGHIFSTTKTSAALTPVGARSSNPRRIRMPTQAPAAAGKQVQVRPRSFLVGTQHVIEGADYDQSVTTASAAFPNWALTATGWLKGLELDILITVATNIVATVATQENYPFNILGNIELDDINNEAIFGPFDSYTAFLTNKYGGFFMY